MIDKIPKKQREASSLKLSFEKASDGNAFKDSLKYEDWILILQRYIENIEKKMEELWIATKNTKESHIKGELQPVSMDETMYFISDKFDELEKDRRKKDEIVNNLSKKTIWNGQEDRQIREFSRLKRTKFQA